MSISAFINTAHSQPRFVLGSGKEIDNPQCLFFQKKSEKKRSTFSYVNDQFEPVVKLKKQIYATEPVLDTRSACP